jgi:hypothetical protein
MQTKRTSNDEITSFTSTTSRMGAMSVSMSSTTTKSSITIQSIEKKKEDDSSVSIMSKFSFLNRDKSYLNRLSSYVNKNLAHAGTGNSKTGGRSNNMVFTSVNTNDNEVLEANEDDNYSNNFTISKVNLKKKNLY